MFWSPEYGDQIFKKKCKCMSFSAIFNREIESCWKVKLVVDFWWFPHSKHAEIEVPQLLLCLQTWCLGPQGSVGTAWNPWDLDFFWLTGHHPLRLLDAAERSGKGNDCRSFCRGYSSFHGDATSERPKGFSAESCSNSITLELSSR